MLLLDKLLKEREEIAKNRWFLSERAQRDVGQNFATINWIIYHRAAYNKIEYQYEKPNSTEVKTASRHSRQ